MHCNNGGCKREVYRGTECYRCWCGTKWDSMKARAENKRNHYPQWAGLALGIYRQEFIRWAEKNRPPVEMKQPSIDRIDSSLGYYVGNIRWLEARQNSRNRAHNVPLSHRLCQRCGGIKELNRSNFHFNRSNPLGFQTYCIPCRSVQWQSQHKTA